MLWDGISGAKDIALHIRWYRDPLNFWVSLKKVALESRFSFVSSEAKVHAHLSGEYWSLFLYRLKELILPN
jgi:hypothetical protein